MVAIALARAAADVVATDLPHVTPLTCDNVAANCGSPLHRCQVTSDCQITTPYSPKQSMPCCSCSSAATLDMIATGMHGFRTQLAALFGRTACL